MDTQLGNGDFIIDHCALPHSIADLEEACQRVKLILSVKKGSFKYNRELGCDYDILKNAVDVDKAARLMCEEALVCQRDIAVDSVSAAKEDSGLAITVGVMYDNRIGSVEVKIDEEL